MKYLFDCEDCGNQFESQSNLRWLPRNIPITCPKCKKEALDFAIDDFFEGLKKQFIKKVFDK